MKKANRFLDQTFLSPMSGVSAELVPGGSLDASGGSLDAPAARSGERRGLPPPSCARQGLVAFEGAPG